MRIGRRFLAALAGLSLIGGAVVVASKPALAAPERWTVAPGRYGGTLAGVSCSSAAHCVAVGQLVGDPLNYDTYRPLIETWNGTTWSRTPSPSVRTGDTFNAVSCPTRSRCVAVGRFQVSAEYSRSLIETFDGRQWSITQNPNVGEAAAILYGVSCPTVAFCVAVGYGNGGRSGSSAAAIIKTWNGARWTRTPSPDLSAIGGSTALSAVSCTSPTACVAVGSMQLGGAPQTLVETWDGTRWSITPTELSTEGRALTVVSCVGTNFCAAAGWTAGSLHYGHTLVEMWDGTRWSSTPSPDSPLPRGDYPSSTLSGVSCVNRSSCVAVGSAHVFDAAGTNRAIVEQWDGTRWTLGPGPSAWPSDRRSLAGVACAKSYRCVAVGNTASSTPNTEALIAVGTTPRRSVSVVLTAAENARLFQIAAYLHQSPDQVQITAVYALAFVIGLGPRAFTRLTLPPPGWAATHISVWNAPDLPALDAVGARFGLRASSAIRASLYFLSYIVALGGH